MNSVQEYLAGVNERRRGCISDGVSNCIGTAFYLVEVQPTDNYVAANAWEGAVNLGNHNDVLRSFDELPDPVLGCLVGWELRNVFFHAGVIVGKSPAKIAQRVRANGFFHKSGSLEFVDRMRGGSEDRVKRYLLPPKLKDAIEKDMGVAA